MKRIVIKIDMINAELAEDPESGLARIFRGLAVISTNQGVESLSCVTLRDINGNKVGTCNIRRVKNA